jgi:hypothetical protein
MHINVGLYYYILPIEAHVKLHASFFCVNVENIYKRKFVHNMLVYTLLLNTIESYQNLKITTRKKYLIHRYLIPNTILNFKLEKNVNASLLELSIMWNIIYVWC